MADFSRRLPQLIVKLSSELLGRLAGFLGLARDRNSLRAALARRRRSGLLVNTVIDVGASDGRWSMAVKNYFPDVAFLLVEAQKAHQPSLEKLAKKYDNVHYVTAAASDMDGEIFFDASDLFGGLASHAPLKGGRCIKVQARTIDSLIQEHRLVPPYLLKFDTHGFELPILAGAKKTLGEARLIVIETYNFKITDGSLRFQEMCSHMEKLGFRCIDPLGHTTIGSAEASTWKRSMMARAPKAVASMSAR